MSTRRTPPAPGGNLAGFQLSVEDKRTLARLFLQTSHEDMRELEHALLGAEFDTVLHRVHRLHGAALTVGAQPMIRELERFERVLRAGSVIPTDSLARLERLRQALHVYQQS